MLISEKTRRNICDELRIENIAWHWRLDETSFLKRIFNLGDLPSTDGRYKDMEGDIWQHRFNNNDWPDHWIFDDSRLDLMKWSDETFAQFLAEMLHPLVRDNETERNGLLELVNDYLKDDSFAMMPENLGRKLRFKMVKTDENRIEIENSGKISRPFIKEQLEKCDRKLAEWDYDWAITNARALLEDVLAKDLHKQITGKEIETPGDLGDYYKKIKALLNLSEGTKADAALKMVTSWITSIVNGIAAVRNTMSDSHTRETAPSRHHAKLVVNSTKTIVDFLYDVLEYQKTRLERCMAKKSKLPYIRYWEGANWKIVCRWLRDRDYILSIPGYKEFFWALDAFLKRMLVNELIDNFEINCYNDSDDFFITLVVLYDVLNADDLERIFRKTKWDSQADWSMRFFLGEVQTKNPEYLTLEMMDYFAKIE